MLANGKSVSSKANINGVTLSLPFSAPDKIASVIKVKVKGSVDGKGFDNQEKMKSGALD
jgi:alpha-L-fucosidase